MSPLNKQAQYLKSLHTPSNPLILTNVYDGATAEITAALPSTKALATASLAIAHTLGLRDEDLTYEQNLHATSVIAKIAAKAGKPLSCDMQDGYGEDVERTTAAVIGAGAVGGNLEDFNGERQQMYAVDEAARRVQRALAAAEKAGVPDFVLNARCDALLHGGTLDDVIERGKKYLEAGATTVYVWGGAKRGVSREEVERLVKEFDGRLNVRMLLRGEGNLSVGELKQMGMMRISVGPDMMWLAMEDLSKRAQALLST